MSMIANDLFPDVPMSTQGTNDWHDQSLGPMVTDPTDGVPGNQNLLTVGDTQGFQWQRARPSGRGTFHATEGPDGVSGAGYAAGVPLR